MTDLDRETTAAIEALIYRLRNRGEGVDDEPFAQEFITAMRARGWRPTEARAPWQIRVPPAGSGRPESEETRRDLEEARRAAAKASARQQAEAQAAGEVA